MKKLFYGLFLFFMSSFAFAGDSWNVSGGVDPVANHTDLSIAYLAQVFGTVGNSLQGTTGQMLGMLFEKLNEGIMAVAGLWLIYTIITILLRSAMDGSFMGPNKNVFWIVIRIALAFAMLIPGPITGYNVIQDIVMKVVIEGVSLADQTWNFGLDYIKAGGTLWRTPETTGNGSGSAVVSQDQAKDILKPTESIFNAEVCMVASSIQNVNNVVNSPSTGVANTTASPVTYSIVQDNTNNNYSFPGLGNTKDYATNIPANKETPACGYVSWNDVPGAKQNSTTPQLAQAALSQIVFALYPAAQKYACANYQGAGGTSVCSGIDTTAADVYPDNQNATFNSLVNYVNGIYPVAQAAHEGSAKTAMRWFSDAKKTGWMVAGRYYWDLSQIQSYEGQVSDLGNYAPPQGSGYDAATDQSQTLKDFMASNDLTNAWNIYENGNTSYPNGALQLLSNYSSASSAGNTGSATAEYKKGFGNKVLDALLGGIVGDIIALFALFSSHGVSALAMGPDPIMFMHEVGMQCIAIAGDIWIELAIVIFGLSAVTMVCQGTLNLDTPVSAVTNWIKPPLMILATALLGVGVILGYYVPLYPFMLFTFGVIGWIISVIEAMVAGPLIAFGLTHPEGHDFLGEAKQGLTLLLGVFLRPVLMVIGLIAGMIVSYVSLRILVYTYSGFLRDIFYQVRPYDGSSGDVLLGAAAAFGNVTLGGGTSLGALLTDLIAFPLMLGIFAALVYVVTNQCFSLIYVLPDYILRWIGGPNTSSAVSAGDMARQVQGSVGQMGSTMGEMPTKGLGAASDKKDRMEESGQGSKNENNKSMSNIAPKKD